MSWASQQPPSICSPLAITSRKSIIIHLLSTTRSQTPWQDGQVTNTSDGEDTWNIVEQLQDKMKQKMVLRSNRDGIKMAVLLCLVILCSLANLVVCWDVRYPSHFSSRRAFFKHAANAMLISQTMVPPANARNLPVVSNVDSSKTGTVDTLIPVIKLQCSIDQLIRACRHESRESFFGEDVRGIIQSVPDEEAEFKSIFDAYSDPVSYKQRFVDQNAFLVYYTKGFDGPGRPSIESDLPEKQTLQFGARNDAWVSWDDFLAEYEYSNKHPEDASFEDLKKALYKTMDAITRYLSLAPLSDVDAARLVASQ